MRSWLPARSARSEPLEPGEPTAKPWMSPRVLPSLRASSGSLLVTDRRANVPGPDSGSVICTDAVTGTMRWSGGHSTWGLTPHCMTGAAVSMRMVTARAVVTPAPFVTVHVSVSPAVSAVSVTGAHPPDDAVPPVMLHDTVTGTARCQPAAFAAGDTTGVTTAGVVTAEKSAKGERLLTSPHTVCEVVSTEVVRSTHTVPSKWNSRGAPAKVMPV